MIAVVVVSGCIQAQDDGEVIVITDGMVIDPQVCVQKGLSDKVVMFHSPTCPACKDTLPVIEDIEDEIDSEIIYIDIASEREKAEQLGLMPTHIPTLIIKCSVYTGYKNKEGFLELIGG